MARASADGVEGRWSKSIRGDQIVKQRSDRFYRIDRASAFVPGLIHYIHQKYRNYLQSLLQYPNMIKHTISKTTPGEQTLLITVDEQFIAPYKQSVIKRLKKNLKVDGFRPGNVPDNIAERELGEAKVQAEVLQEVLMHAYSKIIREAKIDTVASPQINLKKFVPYNELEFEAVVAIMPDIKINIKQLKVKKTSVKVDQKEIDSTLQNLATQSATKTDSKSGIKTGDEVKFDFSGVRQGKPVEGASATNHKMIIGEGSFIPGFEENMLGLKKDDKKTFTVKFPKEYHAKDLADKDVDFSVEIKEIKSVDQPKIDDAWAKTVGPVQNLKELKTEIEKSLMQTKQADADKEFENAVLEAAISQAKITAPASLVSEQTARLRSETEENLKNSGLDLEKYLQLQGQKPADFEAQITTEAEKRVKLGLVLRSIIEQEKITVTETEIDNELARMKTQYTDPKMQEELTHGHFRDDLKNHLLTQKAIAVLATAATQ